MSLLQAKAAGGRFCVFRAVGLWMSCCAEPAIRFVDCRHGGSTDAATRGLWSIQAPQRSASSFSSIQNARSVWIRSVPQDRINTANVWRRKTLYTSSAGIRKNRRESYTAHGCSPVLDARAFPGIRSARERSRPPPSVGTSGGRSVKSARFRPQGGIPPPRYAGW